MMPLDRKGTFAYSTGLFAAGIFFAFNLYTLPLYLSIYTNNAIIIGWLSSTRSVEQAIIQPIIGAWSDRTHSRFGRRAPFFLTAMPIAALLLIVSGLLPHDPGILLLVIVVVFAFSFLFNVGIDPYYALLADVTTPEQRGTVNGIAQVFGFAGQAAALVAAIYLWSIHPAWVFAFIAVFLLVGFGTVALGVREHPIEPEPVMERKQVSFHRRILQFFVYIRHLFSEQGQAMKLLGVKFLYQFGINAAAPFITLFVVNEIGLKGWPSIVGAIPFSSALGLANVDANGVSQFIPLVMLVTMGITAAPLGIIGDRFGKRRIFGLGLVLMGISAFFAANSDNIPQLLVWVVLLGIGNAAQTVLFFPYLTELIPASRVGEFTGLSAFAETGGVVFSVLLAGALINLNLFGLHYRLVFMVTALFILLAFGALLWIHHEYPRVQPIAGPMPEA